MTEKRHVLVVDDDMDTRTQLFDLLEHHGYRVGTCSSALEAVQYVVRNHPQVVIADVRMPEIGGTELLSTIKSVWPATRVIMLTAYGNPRLQELSMKKGAIDFISKPYEKEGLLETVRQAFAPEDDKVSEEFD